ncbi:hypothetical protein [Streptomyces sp. NPDC059575]|uniref:hypothetical protein n=1 Tax=Streptomyces sp. NPDC059575 TaxID=3346872 RepID=UPI0036B06DEB
MTLVLMKRQAMCEADQVAWRLGSRSKIAWVLRHQLPFPSCSFLLDTHVGVPEDRIAQIQILLDPERLAAVDFAAFTA